MESLQNVLIGILVLAALVAANVFLCIPNRFLVHFGMRAQWVRWGGWGLGYCVVIVLGMLFEQYLGQNASQGWSFWVVTAFVYMAFTFPGFVYRYLWRKTPRY